MFLPSTRTIAVVRGFISSAGVPMHAFSAYTSCLHIPNPLFISAGGGADAAVLQYVHSLSLLSPTKLQYPIPRSGTTVFHWQGPTPQRLPVFPVHANAL